MYGSTTATKNGINLNLIHLYNNNNNNNNNNKLTTKHRFSIYLNLFAMDAVLLRILNSFTFKKYAIYITKMVQTASS